MLERALSDIVQEVRSLRQRVLPLDAEKRLRDQGRAPRMPIEFRAQFAEDIALHSLLGDTPDGIIIEVGAFDGKTLSVSYALDAIGWDCLLIEAIPDRHAQCVNNRPHARVVHAALSHDDAPAELEFTITDDHFGGMLSYLTTDADHLAAIKDNKNPTRQVRVPVTTMNALLEGETRPIAAASIDVEGGEVDLLKGFDLARHRPRILIIEDNTRSKPGPAKVSPVERYMLTQPYTYVGFIGCNRLYIRADLTDLIARARAM
jgi:FkbM family methyltransferase